jgi:hypothetical protein
LAGLPMAPVVAPNYSQAIGDAFNAASLANDVFGRNDGGAKVETSNPVYTNPNANTWGGNMGSSFYQLNPVRR